MKLVIDIADNEAESFLELLKCHSYVKAKPLSAPDASVLEELKHLKKAIQLADQVNAGTYIYPAYSSILLEPQ
ncbi:MAG: hypothetical protein M3O71_23715 [Bacteroidota bacterium]|nr:hypothetical protein [Bacteroidota bacterium]